MGWCGSSWISNFTVNGEDASNCPECGCVEMGKLLKTVFNNLEIKNAMQKLLNLYSNVFILVNGSWSSWQSWTECSKSCGGGMKERTRTCTNPPPEYTVCTASNDTTVTGDGMIETEIMTCNNDTCPTATEPGMFSFQL